MKMHNKIVATLVMLLVGAPAQGWSESLRQEIAQARSRAPEAFARVEALRAQIVAHPPAWERRANVSRAMKALGPDALMPLVALLSDGAQLQGAPAGVQTMLRVGALEAIGALRDRRAAPVLRQILDGNERNAPVDRAAAEALGMLADDDSIAYLAAQAVAGDARERAAIAGLGFARRAPAVVALRARLDSGPSESLVEPLAEAMGWLGSSWAWQALGPTRADEGLALRDELSASLVRAYPLHRGHAREAIARALLMIDHPSTPNRLAQLHGGADQTLLADLQSLEHRWLRVR